MRERIYILIINLISCLRPKKAQWVKLKRSYTSIYYVISSLQKAISQKAVTVEAIIHAMLKFHVI